MKGFLIKFARIVLKYVVPIVLGYLEGDSHVIEDNVLSIF